LKKVIYVVISTGIQKKFFWEGHPILKKPPSSKCCRVGAAESRREPHNFGGAGAVTRTDDSGSKHNIEQKLIDQNVTNYYSFVLFLFIFITISIIQNLEDKVAPTL
jgi:hypothetical protein